MTQLILLAAAGGLGAAARYAVSRTWLVNLLGAYGAGCAAGWLHSLPPSASPPEWIPVVTLGFLGAFTTYSTWSLEGVEAMRQGRFVLAAVRLAGTLVVGVGLAALGWWMGSLGGGWLAFG